MGDATLATVNPAKRHTPIALSPPINRRTLAEPSTSSPVFSGQGACGHCLVFSCQWEHSGGSSSPQQAHACSPFSSFKWVRGDNSVSSLLIGAQRQPHLSPLMGVQLFPHLLPTTGAQSLPILISLAGAQQQHRILAPTGIQQQPLLLLPMGLHPQPHFLTPWCTITTLSPSRQRAHGSSPTPSC